MAAVVFWSCVGGVIYHYVGYPITVWVLSLLFGRTKVRSTRRGGGDHPSVSLLIVALNEEEVIADRIANALLTDYPSDHFEIVVASDGSTDRTATIVREYQSLGVRLIDSKVRRGKATVLNAVIPSLKGNVVVLSDANTFLSPESVRQMVNELCEPNVGVVVGRLVLRDPATGRNVDGLYWRYETFIKQCESKLGALLGANGAIYAFHRRLFVPLPQNTLVDDFVLPLLIKLRSGCRLVFDGRSVAHEDTPAHLASEVGRRSRIGAGGFGSLSVLWPLLLPTQGWTAFAFASHKVLRWICPFLLVGAFVSNAFLLSEDPFRLLFAGQLMFYGSSLLGAYASGSSKPVKVIRLATLFTSVNAALLVGFWRWATGQRHAVWERTTRIASS